MSDLLQQAELELAHERARSAAERFAAEQKQAVQMRDKSVSALRAFLPKDRAWNIEPLGVVQLWEGGSWGRFSRGLEMTVDGLTFGYGEGNDGGRPWNQLYLRTSCKECGGPIWNRVNTIASIASIMETDGTQQCPSCKQKQEEREARNDAAVSLEDPDGRWLTITWEGQIKTGRTERVSS